MANTFIAAGVRAASSRFEEIDALTEAIRQWDLDFIQLDRGRFDGSLFQMLWNGIEIQRARFGRAIEQRGSAPEGVWTFGIPASPRFSILWRGHRAGGSNIMVFPPGGELYSVTDPDFDVFTFSVPRHWLAEVAAVAGLPELGHARLSGEVFRCDDGAMNRLRSLLKRVAAPYESSGGAEPGLCPKEELEFELPAALLSTLFCGRVAPAFPTSRLRSRALRQAEQFINEHSDQPLRVSELCRATDVSERTLRYAFMEKFGIGPKAYLAARQLDLVKKALRRAEPAAASVAEIAGRCGFWHMGQFAADYRRQFGTRPLATLRGDDPPRRSR